VLYFQCIAKLYHSEELGKFVKSCDRTVAPAAVKRKCGNLVAAARCLRMEKPSEIITNDCDAFKEQRGG
jgi:hypothetical protein